MSQVPFDKKLSSISTWLGVGSINVFGAPFAGKDTQSNKLGSLLGAEVIGGGEILRSYPDQAKIKRLALSGKLFPTDFYLSVILPYISRPEYKTKPLVLTSVGRWLGEEKVVMQAARSAGHPIKSVVLINLPPGKVAERFEASRQQNDRGQRHDDASHLIDVRLSEFEKKTLPVIEIYLRAGLLIEIDGDQPAEAVTSDIINALFEKSQSD